MKVRNDLDVMIGAFWWTSADGCVVIFSDALTAERQNGEVVKSPKSTS
jgi:hypothetical protein